jgi:hypothetical protein
MPFDLFIDDTCPKCRMPVKRASIERHPFHRDLALQNFKCADCGHVKTKVISLKPGDPPTSPEAAA